VVEKKSLTEILNQLTHLPNRTPEMAFTGEADSAFSDIALYRDGVIAVGYYSGSSEWERHPSGDEIVMAIEGSTTLVLLVKGQQHRVVLGPGELVVVPQDHWHRFEASAQLKVMSVTPQPTEHSLETPGI
jgi:mannose-6-phosphate isomerase-like protein (cupin superfamily)